MGYLIIKDVDINNIVIKEHQNIYKINYRTKHITLSGLYIRLYDIVIKETLDNYIIYINSENSLRSLKLIDNYLVNKFHTKSLLINNMLMLKKNDIIDKLIKKYSQTIDININMIKKVAYQISPIVYLL
jgi:hypothetical protein